MHSLDSIPGIGGESLELLEAAGFQSVEALAGADAGSLAVELGKANAMLGIAASSPDEVTVAEWIRIARGSSPVSDENQGNGEEAADAGLIPVDYERTGEVAELLEKAPFAIPLPALVLRENRLGVGDIPPGVLLNRYSGDLDVRVDERMPERRRQEGPVSSKVMTGSEDSGPRQKLDIDVSKVRSMDELEEGKARIPAMKDAPVNDRVALLRAPKPGTNKGKNPRSRWYIRGVLHSHPISIWLGAFITLLTMAVVPLAVASGALLVLSNEVPERFGWVPGWILAFPISLPVLGLAYLIWGLGGSCRICGQKLFMHRMHLKNVKAHHVPMIGYVLPLCFHILLFRWFRCTHCGTPVRLKK